MDLRLSQSSLCRELFVSSRQRGLLHLTYFQQFASHRHDDFFQPFVLSLFRAQNSICMCQLLLIQIFFFFCSQQLVSSKPPPHRFSWSPRTSHTLSRLPPYSSQAPRACTHQASRTTTIIDIRVVSSDHRAATQPEETTRKLRPHVSPAQAVLAWRRTPDIAHLLSRWVWWS